ncbi:MAG: hypothetical protein J6R45_01610 [Clostridia bacterium]|nr:hypothetical protein [Clostridia bacterium]
MKKFIALLLLAATMVSTLAFVGCEKANPDEQITKLVEVLSVNDDGFVGKIDNENVFVQIPNAKDNVKVGDIVEIVYRAGNRYIADAEGWTSVISAVSSYKVK